MSVTPDSTSDLSRRTLLRRAAAAGLLATPAAGLLAACAGSEPEKKDDSGAKNADNPFGAQDGKPVKVVNFNGGLGTEWAEFDKTVFNKKHPNITVNLSATQKIKTEEGPKMAATPSDVIMNSGADLMDLSTLINEGAIAPLDDLLDAPSWDIAGSKVRDTLLPGTVENGTYQGKFFVVNVATSVFGNWYSATLFEKEGWQPPTTFPEFFELAPKIKAKGIAPYVHDAEHGYYPRWAFMATIWKSAGKQAVVDIDNLKENAWKADGILPALEAWEKLVKDKLILPGKFSHTTSQQAHLDGKAAFIQLGTWYSNEMAKTLPPDFKLTLSDYWGLGPTDKAPKDVYAVAGEGFIMPAKAPNQAAAKEFLRAVLSKEGSANFAAKTKSLATTKGSGDGVSDPTLASANELMKNAPKDLILFKFADFYADADKESQNLCEELMAGRLTAQGFVDKMQATMDKIAKDDSIKKQTRTN